LPTTTPDEEWISKVAGQRWVAVTHDKAISRRPNERQAVIRAGLRLIVVVGHAPHDELADNFVRTLPSIQRFLGKHSAPFIARLYRPSASDQLRKLQPRGRIELWLTEP
jgi:hypothetical protein